MLSNQQLSIRECDKRESKVVGYKGGGHQSRSKAQYPISKFNVQCSFNVQDQDQSPISRDRPSNACSRSRMQHASHNRLQETTARIHLC